MKIITKKGCKKAVNIREFRCSYCKCEGVIDEDEFKKCRTVISSFLNETVGMECPCCRAMISVEYMTTNCLYEECAIPEDWDYIPGKTEVPTNES